VTGRQESSAVPQSNAGLYDELVRLREKVHALATRVTTLELHGAEVRKTLDRVETQVNRLSTADEIAEAVARHDQSRNRLKLTGGQKTAILAGLGIVIAGVLRGLFGVELGH
jgi:uncharacterized protein YigA (DUF484 family)